MIKRNGRYDELTREDLCELKTYDDYRKIMPDLRNRVVTVICDGKTDEGLEELFYDDCEAGVKGLLHQIVDDLNIKYSYEDSYLNSAIPDGIIDDILTEMHNEKKITNNYLFLELWCIAIASKNSELYHKSSNSGQFCMTNIMIAVNSTENKNPSKVSEYKDLMSDLREYYVNSEVKGLAKNPDKYQVDMLFTELNDIADSNKELTADTTAEIVTGMEATGGLSTKFVHTRCPNADIIVEGKGLFTSGEYVVICRATDKEVARNVATEICLSNYGASFGAACNLNMDGGMRIDATKAGWKDCKYSSKIYGW